MAFMFFPPLGATMRRIHDKPAAARRSVPRLLPFPPYPGGLYRHPARCRYIDPTLLLFPAGNRFGDGPGCCRSGPSAQPAQCGWAERTAVRQRGRSPRLPARHAPGPCSLRGRHLSAGQRRRILVCRGGYDRVGCRVDRLHTDRPGLHQRATALFAARARHRYTGVLLGLGGDFRPVADGAPFRPFQLAAPLHRPGRGDARRLGTPRLLAKSVRRRRTCTSGGQ